MKKKAEVIEILEKGGYILVDSIYRTARVYMNDDDRDGDSCRYDVAERLEHTAGYKKRYSRGWCMSWYIEKEATADDVAAAALDALDDAVKGLEEAGVISDVKIQPLTAEEAAALTAKAREAEDHQEAEEEEEEEEADAFAAFMDAASDAWDAGQDVIKPAALTPYERVIAKDPDNKNAWRLPGYPGPVYSIRYSDGRGSAWGVHFPSLREYQDEIERLKREGCIIEETTKTEAGKTEATPAETRQEQTDRENRERCQRIAEELEAYAAGRVYRCPECGDVVEDNELFCGCGQQVDLISGDWEQLSLYDYFSDYLDIEYRCDSRREYRSCCIMVACGGPNIYIDTAAKAVQLYWWTDRAKYPLSSDAVDAVDAWAAEYWEL